MGILPANRKEEYETFFVLQITELLFALNKFSLKKYIFCFIIFQAIFLYYFIFKAKTLAIFYCSLCS